MAKTKAHGILPPDHPEITRCTLACDGEMVARKAAPAVATKVARHLARRARSPLTTVLLCMALSGQTARADAPPGHYTVLSAAEARDNRTGLVWARAEESGSFTWADAKTRCAGKGSGYRVPTVRELQSIVDEGAEPAIDTSVFVDMPGSPGSTVWSSTPFTLLSGGWVWVVSFKYGDTGRETTAPLKVRCVR